MSQHTPGPWKAVAKTPNGFEVRAGRLPAAMSNGIAEIAGGQAGEYPVCIEPWSRFTTGAYGEMVAANFRLIAAAPELLEALERTLNWLASYPGEGTMGIDGPYEQARAALAKAKGEA
jgi:hypothetical protein